MGHEVRFHKLRHLLIPLLKREKGNAAFQQGPCSRGTQTTHLLLSVRSKKTVCCYHTHREQAGSTLRDEMEVLMPFQGVEEHRQRRDQAFGTQTVRLGPDQHQCLFYNHSYHFFTKCLHMDCPYMDYVLQ